MKCPLDLPLLDNFDGRFNAYLGLIFYLQHYFVFLCCFSVCPSFNQCPMNIPMALDPLGDYGQLVDPRNRKSFSCKLCGKEINSEISCQNYRA